MRKASRIGIRTEQPERIVSWIRQRVSETGDRDLFELGHNFGELTGGLDSFEKSMSSLLSWYSSDPPIEEEHWPPFVESDLTSQISTLKTHELVQRNNYASSALDQISRLRLRFAFPDDVESPMDVWGQYPTAASIARHASELVWTAIGELLGVLRDVDVAAQVRDAEAVTPRSLTDSDTDEVDRIRQILRMAELDLANNSNQQWRPEATVRQVYQEIEALTKRLWPSEFRTRKSYSLPALWRQKLYCDDEAEKRFAGIALNLYRSYRNVASHEADHFRCSPREARYFLSGIHVLLEIFERISNAADGDASR